MSNRKLSVIQAFSRLEYGRLLRKNVRSILAPDVPGVRNGVRNISWLADRKDEKFPGLGLETGY
jgi:hypothetical protein